MTDELIEYVARAIAPSAFKTFDNYTGPRRVTDLYAIGYDEHFDAWNKWINARVNVKRARCHAARAIAAIREFDAKDEPTSEEISATVRGLLSKSLWPGITSFR